MSLMKSYLNVLNEDKASNFTSSGIADETKKLVNDKPFGNDESEKNKKPAKSYDPDKDVKSEVEEPVDGPHSAVEAESLPSKLESVKNPFDLLFNKILSEEDMGGMEDGFEGSDDGESFDFNTSVEDQDETDSLGEEEGEEEEGEEESLHTVLDHLKSAVEALERLASHEAGESEEEESEEDEDGFDFGDESEDEAEEVPVAEEATDIEEFHPSEDLTQHSNQAVKGTTVTKKPSGKKAEVTKGVKPTGKWEPHTNKGESLQKKNNNVGGVKANNTPLFEQ
jgi:hypothetical protein